MSDSSGAGARAIGQGETTTGEAATKTSEDALKIMKRVEKTMPSEDRPKESKRWPVFNLEDTEKADYYVQGRTRTEAVEEQLRHWKSSENNKALATENVRMAKRLAKRAGIQAGPRTDADCSNSSSIKSSSITSNSTSSISGESYMQGGGRKHETPDVLDATAASSSSTNTTSMPLKAPKEVQEPGFFPAAGAPASTGESLAQLGQLKPDAKATGMTGRVVGLEEATGASSKGGVCGQAAAEHNEQRKGGGEAEDLSEEDPEVGLGDGYGEGPEAGFSSAVAERGVECDGNSTVGLQGDQGADSDSIVPRQAGKFLKTEQGKSSRSDHKTVSVVVAVLTIVSHQFFVSTKHLQCSSLALNEACRRAPTLVVLVGEGYMPPEYLTGSKKEHEAGVPPATAGNLMSGSSVVPESKRVPRILPGGLVWCLPLKAFGQGDVDLTGVRYLRLTETACLPDDLDLPASLEHLDFGDEFNHTIVGVKWPRTLQRLQFGYCFNKRVAGVAWPVSLLRLQFGENFNQPLAKVVWPDSLLQIEFGFEFNQSIVVDWPASLYELKLGFIFDQPIAGVTWPSSLHRLQFGCEFNQSLLGVVWPPTLQHLRFGHCFNKPVAGVVWPPALDLLQFGSDFNQPLADVVWPNSLLQIEFGDEFNQSIVVDWPASLFELKLGYTFDQPITGVTWPSSLHRLQLGGEFNHTIVGVKWPPTLQHLQFGHCFNKPVAGVAWPPALECLQFGGHFNQPLVKVVWPTSLMQLRFGVSFNQPVAGVTWPSSLEHLEFSMNFNQPLAGVVWPPSLERLKFGFSFNCPIHGIEWPSSLQHLAFGWRFNQSIDGVVWPRSALVLKVAMWDEWPPSAQSVLLSDEVFHKPET